MCVRVRAGVHVCVCVCMCGCKNVKRNLGIRQKRPTIEAKETYYRGKRDLGIRQKRPMHTSAPVVCDLRMYTLYIHMYVCMYIHYKFMYIYTYMYLCMYIHYISMYIHYIFMYTCGVRFAQLV